MEEYNKFIGQMNEILNSEDIVSDEEIISIKDLKAVIEYKLNDFKKAISNLELADIKYKNIFSSVRIHCVEKVFSSSFIPDVTTIVIMLNLGFDNYDYVRVSRDNRTHEIFMDSYYDRVIDSVIKKAEPYLNQIFEEYNKIADLLYALKYYSYDGFVTSDDLFQFCISLDSKYDVKVSPLQLSYKKQMDSGLEKLELNNDFQKHSEELYSKTGVLVKNLNNYLQDIIGEYFGYTNQTRKTCINMCLCDW